MRMGYSPLIQTLMARGAFRNHDAFMEILATMPGSGANRASLLEKDLREQKIYEGLKIAEIGGIYAKDFFQRFGATVDAADFGRDDEQRRSLDRKKADMINWENYRGHFPQAEYDIVCTNRVLALNAGFAEAEKHGGIPADEFYALEYALVRDGGAIENRSGAFSLLERDRDWARRSLRNLRDAYLRDRKIVTLYDGDFAEFRLDPELGDDDLENRVKFA